MAPIIKERAVEAAAAEAKRESDCESVGGHIDGDSCIVPPPPPVVEPVAAPTAVYYGNGYDYGQCTYYVASRRSVPGNWGNAVNWFAGAQASGFSTGDAPRAGAIGVQRWGNHVVYIESVEGPTVTLSEMNAAGWNVIDTRTDLASNYRYIY